MPVFNSKGNYDRKEFSYNKIKIAALAAMMLVISSCGGGHPQNTNFAYNNVVGKWEVVGEIDEYVDNTNYGRPYYYSEADGVLAFNADGTGFLNDYDGGTTTFTYKIDAEGFISLEGEDIFSDGVMKMEDWKSGEMLALYYEIDEDGTKELDDDALILRKQ